MEKLRNFLKNVKKFGLFGLLYFVQGIPGGFVVASVSLFVLRLQKGGMTEAGTGSFLFVVAFPWMVKPFVGLLVDLRGTRLRWIVGSTVVMALSLLALAIPHSVLPSGQAFTGVPWAVLLLALVHNTARAFQDVATDAMAQDTLKKEERGSAETFMNVGGLIGEMVGGSGMILLHTKYDWWVLCILVASLMLVLGVLAPLWIMRGKESLRAASGVVESGGSKGVFGELWRAVKEPFKAFYQLVPGLALLLALLSYVGKSMVDPVLWDWFTKGLTYEKPWISFLLNLNQWASVGGAVLGGVVAWRLSRKWAGVLAIVLLSTAYTSWGLTVGYWPSKWFILALTMATSATEGIYIVVLITIFRDISVEYFGSRARATVFACFMGALNFGIGWPALVGGYLAEHYLKFAQLFLVGGLVQFVALVPLLLLMKFKKK